MGYTSTVNSHVRSSQPPMSIPWREITEQLLDLIDCFTYLGRRRLGQYFASML